MSGFRNLSYQKFEKFRFDQINLEFTGFKIVKIRYTKRPNKKNNERTRVSELYIELAKGPDATGTGAGPIPEVWAGL